MIEPSALVDRGLRYLAPCCGVLVALAALSGGPRATRLELDFYDLLAIESRYASIGDDPFTPQDLERLTKLPPSPWPLVPAGCPRRSSFVVASNSIYASPSQLESMPEPTGSLPLVSVFQRRPPAASLLSAVALELGKEVRPFQEIDDPDGEPHAGVVVRVINQWHRPLAFDSSEETLSVVQQALGTDRIWRDIERPGFRDSCGRSLRYHMILEPGQYWEIVAPRYEGSMPALLRFKLERHEVAEWFGPLYQKVDRSQGTFLGEELPAVYSAPFWGSITPESVDSARCPPPRERRWTR